MKWEQPAFPQQSTDSENYDTARILVTSPGNLVVYICRQCGALIADRNEHDKYHEITEQGILK